MTPPLATVLLWAVVASLAAGGGAYVGAGRLGADGARREAGRRILAWANASAAGLMLGIAYAVLMAGAALAPLGGTIAAAAGVVAVHLLGRHRGGAGASGALAASARHSAAEGVAIGAAAALDVAFGAFLVLTFAVHNVSEGAILGSALARVMPAGRAAVATTLARLGQPALAAATILAVRALPATLPWALGAAAGALIYLALAELLPSSYRQTGESRTSVAVVVSVAAGIVALLGGRAR